MMYRALFLLVCGALMTASCVEISGERDVLEGHMLRHQPYATFPQPNPPEVLPLVMIVGPEGATECWATQANGLPWSGPVDDDRTVTVARHPLQADALGQRYECGVRTPGHLRVHVVTRYVAPIEFPREPELQRRLHEQQIEQRRQQCERDPVTMRQFGLSCDLSTVAYRPSQRLLPLIVHVGPPDERARQRWAELRERLTARCAATGAGAEGDLVEQARRDRGMCGLLAPEKWEAMEEADLGPRTSPP